jgi:O-antigen/teichoic acid export membrane protein
MLNNGLYNLIGAGVRIVLSIITIPIVISLIGVSEYGLLSLVLTVIGIFTLAEAGLSIATTVFLAKDISQGDQNGISETLTISCGAMLILASLVAAILWFQAKWIADFFPNLNLEQATVLIKGLKYSSIIIWLQLQQRIFVGIEQAYERYDYSNLVNIIQSVMNNLGSILVAWMGGKTEQLVLWQMVVVVTTFIIHSYLGFLIIPKHTLHLLWNKMKAVSILKYSYMTWMTTIGGVLFSQGDRLIVGRFFSTEILGIYSLMTSISANISGFSSLPIQPMLPRLSYELGENSGTNQIESILKKALQVNFLFALGLGGTLLTIAPIIINWILKKDLSIEYIASFRIAIFIYSLYSLNAVGYYVLFATNNVNICMIRQLTAGIFSLLAIAIGAYYFGIAGAVVGNAGFIYTLSMLFDAKKILKHADGFQFAWVEFPVFWFIGVVLISIYLTQNYPGDLVTLSILGLQTAVLVIWSRQTLLNFLVKKPI